jgi:Ser/Thr protein kinase RdoA (MazF antagonist)
VALGEAFSRLTDDLASAVADTPVQTLHGDAGAGNLMAAGGGWVWHDFEDAGPGPVAWDLAATTASPRLDRARILAAYGEPVDPAQLRACEQLRRLNLTVWYCLYAERLPGSGQRAAELLASWRTPSLRARGQSQPGGDRLGVGAADDPLVVGSPLEADPQPAGRVVVDCGEEPLRSAQHRADLHHAGNSGADLDAGADADGSVGVAEDLDSAHRGQRRAEVAVDALGLLQPGEVEHQIAALDAQLSHPDPLASNDP